MITNFPFLVIRIFIYPSSKIQVCIFTCKMLKLKIYIDLLRYMKDKKEIDRKCLKIEL